MRKRQETAGPASTQVASARVLGQVGEPSADVSAPTPAQLEEGSGMRVSGSTPSTCKQGSCCAHSGREPSKTPHCPG